MANTVMPPTYRYLWIVLLCVCVWPDPGLEADTGLADLREAQRESRKLAQITREMEETATRVTHQVADLEKRLIEEERALEKDKVDVAMLAKARVELESIQASLTVVEGRIEHHTLKLGRLRAQIAQLEQRLAAAEHLDLELLRLEAGLEQLRQQKIHLQQLLEVFDQVMSVGQRKAALLKQRLRLFQSRLTLEDISPAASMVKDKRIPMLESLIVDFLSRAARLFRQADGIVGDTPVAQARRHDIEQMANATLTRAYLRQNDLELILTENHLASLMTLLDDASMPLHVLKSAQRKLREISKTLVRIDGGLANQSKILESRQATQHDMDADASSGQLGIENLQALIGFQRSDIDALRQRLSAAQTAFAREIADKHAASLLEHQTLPGTAADWQRIATSIRHLPQLMVETLEALWKDLRFHAAEIEFRRILMAALGIPALILLILWGSRHWRITSRGPEARRSVALITNAFANALPRAIPAVVWGLIAMLLEVRLETWLPLMLLLGLWPLYTFAQQFVRNLLLGKAAGQSADNPAGTTFNKSQQIYRQLNLGLKVTVGIATVYLLSKLLPLSPLLSDLLDQFTMLALLLLLIPAFGLKKLTSEKTPSQQTVYVPLAKLYGVISRILPLLITLISLVGLMGYTNLAKTLIQYSLWALVVAFILFFTLGLLKEVTLRINARLEQSVPNLAPFWRTHFVEPGFRVMQLASLIAGGWLLFQLWGWNAETPMLRWFLDVIETQLFTLGERVFTIGDLLISLVLVGVIFWIGGWTKQVSYQLAYRRIRDLGLRQALATFTQYVVIVIGVLLALSVIGFDLTTLTVFLASLGVGIGFGLQNIVNNFLSGILLLAERPLVIGDFVSIGPHKGHVTQIGIRSLTVRTLDKQEVVIPNGTVISKEFTNWTRSDDVVRDVQYLTIQYASDREHALQLINEILAEHPQVLPLPEPGAFLAQYMELGVRLRFQYYYRLLDGPGRLVICSELLMEIGRRFTEDRIAFAEPKLLPSIPVSDGTQTI
jgi:potassium efflux system protein